MNQAHTKLPSPQSAKKPRLSVIIPTLNESKNIQELVTRLANSLTSCTSAYELIFIDDHSTDSTLLDINHLAKNYPVRALTKVGKKGKSFSLLQGFKLAKFELIAMIDADLQYPPEALVTMLKEVSDNKAEVVIAKRTSHNGTYIRSFGSVLTSQMYRLLFGFDYDVQSGLKLFKKTLLIKMNFDVMGPWTFDLTFLYQAVKSNYSISSVNIKFMPRLNESSKVSVTKVGLEVFLYALRIKLLGITQFVSTLLNRLWLKQFVKFSIIGVINTTIDLSIYFVLIRFVHFFMINFAIAKAISYAIASCNSFILNRRYTFRSTNRSLLLLFPFLIVGIFGLAINTVTVYVLVKDFNFSQVIGVSLATALILVYNFSISKFYIFSSKSNMINRLKK